MGVSFTLTAEAKGSVAEAVGLSSWEAEVGLVAIDKLDEAVVLFVGIAVVVAEEIRNL